MLCESIDIDVVIPVQLSHISSVQYLVHKYQDNNISTLLYTTIYNILSSNKIINIYNISATNRWLVKNCSVG